METGQHRRVLPRCPCGYFFVGIAIFAAVIVAAIVLVITFSTKAPSISVASASVSAFGVSASSISGVWDINFDVRNKNTEVTASFEKVQALVYYKEANLSQTSIQPFHQDNRNGTTVRTSLSAMGAHVDPSIINAINGERAASGSVDFTVILSAEIKYRAPGWWKESISFHLDATCRTVSIALPENSNQGTLAGGSRACSTDRGHVSISALGIVFILGVILVCSSLAMILVGLIRCCQRLEWY